MKASEGGVEDTNGDADPSVDDKVAGAVFAARGVKAGKPEGRKGFLANRRGERRTGYVSQEYRE